MPKVSVIVAIYKSEAYLKQCVDSLTSQTFRDIEIILIDDGSPDGCPDICDNYQKQDSRVKVIHQTNSGQTVARQNGFKKSTGEYILFFDSDDWLEANAIEIIYKTAIDYKADIVTYNGYFNYSNHQSKVKQRVKSGFYDKSKLIKDIYPKMIFSGEFFKFSIYAAMWNKLFKRSVVEKNILRVKPSIRIGEDGLTTFASLLQASSLYVLGNRFLYHYRDNNPSITRLYCPEQFKSAKELIAQYRKIAGINRDLFDIDRQIDYYYLYNIYAIIIEEFYYKYKKPFRERYRYIRRIIDDSSVFEVVSKNLNDGMNNFQIRLFKLISQKRYLRVVLLGFLEARKRRIKLNIRTLLGRY